MNFNEYYLFCMGASQLKMIKYHDSRESEVNEK